MNNKEREVDNELLELLYRSVDDELSPGEMERLEKALGSSKELRDEKDRLRAIREAVSSGAARSFEPFFAERVMQGVRELKTPEGGQDLFFQSLFSVFRPLAATAAIFVIALLSLNLITNDSLSVASAFAMPDVTVEEAFDPTLTLALEWTP